MNERKPTPLSPSPPASGPNDSTRRAQIGIAGVLAVLLLVGLAELIGDRAREQVENDAATAVPVAPASEKEKGSGAPLEELGVQPVSKSDPEKAAPIPKFQPLPQSTAKVPDLEPDPELQRAKNKSKQ